MVITEAHGIMRNMAASWGRLSIIIIDPHEILLLGVCVGSSILVASMWDNCDAHRNCSLCVMTISSILMVPSIVM